MATNIPSTLNPSNIPQVPSQAQVHADLSNRLAKLKDAFAGNKAVDFDMGNELRYVHSSLRSNPAISYLLTDEEIGIITRGFSQETSIVLVAPKVKVAKAPVALSLDDI